MTPSVNEVALLDRWQRGFPLTERPFAEVGRDMGLDEDAIIAVFRRLRDCGVVSRIGAVVRPRTVGASTLAAMRVPPQRMNAVADIVSRERLVSHNYERTHPINLWFVVAGAHAGAIAATLGRIEMQTGLPVLDLPLQRAYHLDLGFPLTGERRHPAIAAAGGYRPDRLDRRLLAAIEDGLPLIERPFNEVATSVGLDEGAVIARLRRLTAAGVISRFGCVVRHRLLGYTANAMAVWDIPDDTVDHVAGRLAGNPRVSLCYRRPRRRPHWPYNLFCMVHAKTRPDAYAVIDDLNRLGATGCNDRAVLFSTRCFKQRGAVFSEQ
jgi:DNA-binding Lrp family transcriptional regulator